MAYGNVNVDTITTSTSGGVLGAGNASIMKNRCINGQMVIDQRNAGASVSIQSSTGYTLDRWNTASSQNSKFSVQQNAGSVTTPAGFTNYLGVTSSSAYTVGSSELFTISQPIEAFNTADLAWGTANAKTVTVSFQVYSSLTGTFGGALRNATGSRCYPFSYSIASANTWTSISVTIAGDTSGTWAGSTNGIGIYLSIGLGVGSTLSGTAGSWSSPSGAGYFSSTGAVSVVGTNGATFYITGVQLEVGSSATGFEYRQYTTELSLCQRYYFLSSNGFMSAYWNGTGSYPSNQVFFPTSMRAAPTVTFSGTSFSNASAIGAQNISTSGFSMYITSSGLTGSASTPFSLNASIEL